MVVRSQAGWLFGVCW